MLLHWFPFPCAPISSSTQQNPDLEEDQSVLVETSARFSACFLAGIEDPSPTAS